MRWLWLSALLLILDQASKYLIAGTMSLYQSIPLSGFFNLVYVHNHGAAFSFLSTEGGWQRWLFTAIAVSISALLAVLLKRTPAGQPLTSAGYALVISGALGNVFDRLILGYVIDFLDFHWQGYHWPAFNVADSCICIGAVLLVLDSFLHPSRSKSKESK